MPESGKMPGLAIVLAEKHAGKDKGDDETKRKELFEGIAKELMEAVKSNNTEALGRTLRNLQEGKS
jgi:hypothetical protein